MPTRSRRRVALAATTAALIAAAPLVFAEPAFAQYPPCPPLQVSDDTVAPGDELTFSATCFEPEEEVDANLVPDGAATTQGGASTAALRTSPSFVQPIAAPTAEGGHGGGDGGGDRGTVYLGTYTAYANGGVDGTVTIPEHTRPGHYRFTLEGESSGITQSAPLTVTGDGNGRPGDGDGHGRPGHGDDHGRPGHGHHPGSGHGNGSGHDPDPSELATTGSSDATVALLSAAGGLVLLGGGSLVIVRRRRSHTERG
ncbi:LPXTG cell wall anchor domain-containing protein [Streptomyces sp. NBC_00210]|uniref:LPXTG cell wall anchor domain-containing protein n=1 Tax=unclassified Streptomyces TaxID=2593676 RepID=UPI003254B7A3